MAKYEKASPRSEIKRELLRAQGKVDWVIWHLGRAAYWADKGGRPEVAEYLAQFGGACVELKRAMQRFIEEVLGYGRREETEGKEVMETGAAEATSPAGLPSQGGSDADSPPVDNGTHEEAGPELH